MLNFFYHEIFNSTWWGVSNTLESNNLIARFLNSTSDVNIIKPMLLSLGIRTKLAVIINIDQ